MTQTQTQTQTSTSTSIETTVDGYFAIWNEADPARRRARLAAVWSPQASYVDPMFTAAGLDALDGLVGGLHQNYPGHTFRRTGALDVHHDRARWGWDFVGPYGSLVMSGIDVAILDADGRLRDVTGFFQPPAASGQAA